ncbi:ester cyclase [Chitinophaga sp. GbtcB8]|uniref:ester cyclase n=1 Tax=Chitinophaga sp. GbtcB8 TaxID=2824753 RepID=UPI001C301604|nr:ester cyclase [Chitinophaga sp. GbtcB8]
MATANEAHYLRYISFLNERRLDDLSEFVQEKLTYNGEAMTRTDYQNLIAGDIAAIPDLYFDVHLLVVKDDTIACRIKFDCTPQDEFLGFRPNGKKISFSEHVFYQLKGGKIAEVWSLIDTRSIQSQLEY